MNEEGMEEVPDPRSARGIHGDELPGVRLVAPYGHRSGLVLGQKGGWGANARRVNRRQPRPCCPAWT